MIKFLWFWVRFGVPGWDALVDDGPWSLVYDLARRCQAAPEPP
ncbi:hypothetical protein ACFYVL_01345 [Streptomyces sp. NPDC004111]